MEVEVYCNGFLLPLLREMGTRLDIAREHMASALIRQRLRALLDAEEQRPDGPARGAGLPGRGTTTRVGCWRWACSSSAAAGG